MESYSDGQFGGGSKDRNISSGFSSGNSTNFADSTYELKGIIDISDKWQVERILSDFEEHYKDSEIEHCIVITTTGEIYEVHGGKWNVDPSILGERMRGSINEHNHVTGESQYSFSKEDIYESVKDSSKVAMAFDEKYKYSMTFNNAVSPDDVHETYVDASLEVLKRKMRGEIITDENEQHEIIKSTCASLGIKYERWSK